MHTEYYYYFALFLLSIVIITKLMEVKKESFTDTDDLANGVLEFMKNEKVEFAEYIQFLRNNKVTNLNLISADLFYEFKTMQKLRLLTKGTIKKVINA